MIFQAEINEETLQDIVNISVGVLAPLTGFMTESEFRGTVDNCLLPDGSVFTIPITMDVPKEIFDSATGNELLELVIHGECVASMTAESKFILTEDDLEKVFKTRELEHPGVRKEKERSPYRIGGKVNLLKRELLDGALNPLKTKRVFQGKGWKTVVGFQTRNPIHKAHEHIQRLGLEICDGLFINPITGWKKGGDFSEEAVIAAYETMVREFYPPKRVYMTGLRTQMRYAGPREAVFHALIRRNLGCTHFIIGRDHAGVGGYYGIYEAHDFARKLAQQYDLGIELILTREPYYCKKCGQIVTDNTCGHYDTDRVEISGTIIRKYISDGYMPDEIMLRREIFDAITKCEHIFVES